MSKLNAVTMNESMLTGMADFAKDSIETIYNAFNSATKGALEANYKLRKGLSNNLISSPRPGKSQE